MRIAPGQGRQAGVPRQLGDGRRRAASVPEERPGRRAVGGAEEVEGRLVVAGQPAGAAAPPRPMAATERRARSTRRRGCGWPGPRSSCAGSSRWCVTVLIALGVLVALQALVLRLGHGAPLAAVRRGARRGRASSPRRSPRWPSGSSSAGSAAGEHPLWSSFVWRNEVVDTFVEMVAAPWFANAAAGTPVLVAVAAQPRAPRSAGGCGARRTGCPRPTWSRLGDGVSVNRGCVLQTHLFHDRVMRLGTVDLDHGATMGPHGVILPGGQHRCRRHRRARARS